jgi:hypothetical protein
MILLYLDAVAWMFVHMFLCSSMLLFNAHPVLGSPTTYVELMGLLQQHKRHDTLQIGKTVKKILK